MLCVRAVSYTHLDVYKRQTLWIANTCFAYNDMVEVIPSKGQLIGAVAVGYAAEKPHPRPRKKLEEILEYVRK